MPRRTRKKPPSPIYLSAGPLPEKLAGQYTGLLVFSDASRKNHGGIAAVLFAEAASEPVVATLTVPLIGSNELELQAALFALNQTAQRFPGERFTLFTDNQDAASWLHHAATGPSPTAPEWVALDPGFDLGASLALATVRWIKGHASCRGNALADHYARLAALGQ